ncbi:hypothetical protein BU16DRAFT_594413 [Lophium mytilinum]|uniref:Fungal N-terminal domain-containing protein n=1 Tax=Lophium mytilinum TaxID=390894 RepID=A0A6A6QH05_9PEZI|nr:hypothetical protein BU16DRAFT_594413 [Lophium mytilinum]
MSDPLSVAGSAAGIASLGIQVCQSLVWYLRSIEGRRQRIADDLKEVQRLVSIFYSLNDILPEIERRGTAESATIRTCLGDSEEKLLELQQLLIKWRGPESRTSTKQKVKEAGRILIHPFQEGKLDLLRQTLQNLLDNLKSAIEVATLKFGVTHFDETLTIRTHIEGLEASSHLQSASVRDLHTKIQENADQLQSLQRNVTDSLATIESGVLRTEWRVWDLGQNMSGRFTLMHTDVTSIASTSSVMADRLMEVMEKTNQMYEIMKQNEENLERYHMRPQCPDSSNLQQPGSRGSSFEQRPEFTLSKDTASTGAVRACPTPKPPMCACPSESRPVTYSYSFWGMKFHYDYQQPSKHHRGCKFFGIDSKSQRNINAQIPIKMARFFTRITYVCMAYTNGSSDLGISVRLKNVVRKCDSPIYDEFVNLLFLYDSEQHSKAYEDIISQIESCERAVLSMYRDGRASPSDRDEEGRSHAMMFVDTILWRNTLEVISSHHSVMAAVLQILQTIVNIVQGEEEKVALGRLVLDLSQGNVVQDQWLNKRMMTSYLADVFEFDLNDLFEWVTRFDAIPSLSRLLVVEKLDVSPMARAILSRSLVDLNHHISRDPEAPMEKFEGFTTLQLCASWPQGLQMLLTTDAKSLIDSDYSDYQLMLPVVLAIGQDCAESVDLLMKAGCTFAFNWENQLPFEKATRECATAIVSNLADRRRRLLELAQRELGSLQHTSSSHVPDGAAAYLCKALDEAGIFIPPSLRVGPRHATMYHYPVIPIHHFRIFFEEGFRDFKSHDDMGLTPIMVWRTQFFLIDIFKTDAEQIVAMLLWLHEQGLLDQTPEDPWRMGLNVHATGWHYIAAMSGEDYENWGTYRDLEDSPPGKIIQQYLLPWKIVRELSLVTVRDNCSCWCNPEGKGCSPLKSLWNAHADRHGVTRSLKAERTGDFLRHIIFHYEFDIAGVEDSELVNLPLELVRLLTFEALEMTHTCCSLKKVSLDRKRIYTYSDWKEDPSEYSKAPYVIANRHRSIIRRIRSDDQERKNAHQLNELMEEFIGQMKTLEPSPKALEIFIWGYWRRRISELFVVNSVILHETEEVLSDVKTYVLPKRLVRFLGDEFDLLRPDAQAIPKNEENVEDIGVSRHCHWCDSFEQECSDAFDGGKDND